MDLIPIEKKVDNIENSISSLNLNFETIMKNKGLPSNILVPISQRKIVFSALDDISNLLNLKDKKKAFYLSKCYASVAVGLFDGAINFMWNETIISLREIVFSYDFFYFQEIVGTLNSSYKKISNLEDMELLSDYDLLQVCQRMGILTDVDLKKMEYANYLRNHASAAHPNDNEISGYELLNLIINCITCAINAKPNKNAIEIKRLLKNIRENEINRVDVPIMIKSLRELPEKMSEDFLRSLFGLYLDTKVLENTKLNIEKVAISLWEIVSEKVKFEIGAKYGFYSANLDSAKKELCSKFLNMVEGNKYKDEDSISHEVLSLLNDLLSTHFRNNNFYYEVDYIKKIKSLIEKTWIPEGILNNFVKIIVICYCGNGNGNREGVDEQAFPIYVEIISKFSDREIFSLLFLFEDSQFLTDLKEQKPKEHMVAMAKYLLEKRSKDIFLKKGLMKIITFKGNLQKIGSDTEYKDILSKIKKNS